MTTGFDLRIQCKVCNFETCYFNGVINILLGGLDCVLYFNLRSKSQPFQPYFVLFDFISENAELPLEMLVLTATNTRRAACYLSEPCFCAASTSFFQVLKNVLLLSVQGYMLHIDPVGFLDFSFFLCCCLSSSQNDRAHNSLTQHDCLKRACLKRQQQSCETQGESSVQWDNVKE